MLAGDTANGLKHMVSFRIYSAVVNASRPAAPDLLQALDLGGNQLRWLPSEVALLAGLQQLNVAANPDFHLPASVAQGGIRCLYGLNRLRECWRSSLLLPLLLLLCHGMPHQHSPCTSDTPGYM